MESFWRRVNNVAVDVACLKQQKRRLEAENSQLKAQLQDYLVDLNIANGSNSHVHSYLARRPKSMSVGAGPFRCSPDSGSTAARCP